MSLVQFLQRLMEAMAIAMNTIGGMSNSGEGGKMQKKIWND